MGRQQGEALRSSIAGALEAIGELEAFQLMKPRLLPLGLFRMLAERKADQFLKQAFAASPAQLGLRCRGIAEGASVPIRKLALCYVLEAVLSDLKQRTTPMLNRPSTSCGRSPSGLQAGCSAIAVTGASSADGNPMVMHNFDYLPVVQSFFCVRRSEPAGKLRSVEFTVAPLVGAVDGINEAGLAITCNYAYVTDRAEPAPTITMVISDVLAHARCVDEAVTRFERQRRVGGGLVMLADASGRIASLEVANSRIARRDPSEGRLFHTNRLQCDPMRSIELHPDARYGKRSPSKLRGVAVHESADRRSEAIASLLPQSGAACLDDLHRILSDHSHGDSENSVCMHGDYWFTTACTQLIPTERKLRVSFSTACEADFSEFLA